LNVLAGGSAPKSPLPAPQGSGTLSNIMCHGTPQTASKSADWFEQEAHNVTDRWKTDRQTTLQRNVWKL